MHVHEKNYIHFYLVNNYTEKKNINTTYMLPPGTGE